MDYEDGIKQINKATEKSVEDKLFLRWIISHQLTVSFDDFKNQLMTNMNTANGSESKEEILANLRKIFMKKVGE